MIAREIRYVASKRHPEAGFLCSADPVLVARVIQRRRFLCVGEQVMRELEYRRANP